MDTVTSFFGSSFFIGVIIWVVYAYLIKPVYRRYKPKLNMYKVNTSVNGEYIRLLIKGSCNREQFEPIAKDEAEKQLIEKGLIEKGQEFKLLSIIQVYEEVV